MAVLVPSRRNGLGLVKELRVGEVIRDVDADTLRSVWGGDHKISMNAGHKESRDSIPNKYEPKSKRTTIPSISLVHSPNATPTPTPHPQIFHRPQISPREADGLLIRWNPLSSNPQASSTHSSPCPFTLSLSPHRQSQSQHTPRPMQGDRETTAVGGLGWRSEVAAGCEFEYVCAWKCINGMGGDLTICCVW